MKKIIYWSALLIFLVNCSFAQVENPVSWKYSTETGKDGTYTLKFKATMEEGWHLYSQNIPEGGPVPTSFTFEESKSYERIGKVNELSKVIKFFDKSFDMEVRYFSHEALFTQKIKVKANDAFTIKGTVEYMCCNDQKCLPPKTVSFEFSIPETVLLQDKKPTRDQLTSSKPATVQQAESGTKVDSSKADVPTPDKKATQLKAEVLDKSKEPESAWGFLFYAFFWGLAGVITPCVYPMIPMTVSFFMRGEEKRLTGIVRGFIFGLSIVAIYTLIGVLVSLSILSPNVGNTLSTHWISNLIFFLLFLVFAASFLGMFEIILPSSLVNKIDQQAEKGGFLAAFFMALTLVIVSFSCTGPIVGKILIESSKGLSIKPIAGMLGYSLAFALPFTFFALFPSMLKSLPKSGGWLNSVKVVLGFIVLAFSLSFVANIDQNYHFNLLSREVFLIIWSVLAFLLGIYLLGKIKFSHDSDVKSIGVPRFLLVVIVFSFGLYLFTGLLGSPLKSMSWILPPQENVIKQTITESKANSNNLCGTPKYSEFLAISNGLSGYFDYQEGLACAKQKNKPVFLDFKGHSCKNCKIMEADVWSDARVLERLRNDFIIIALYTDDKYQLPESDWVKKPNGKVLKRMDEINQDLEITKFENNALPLYAILDLDGNVLGKPVEFTKDVDAYLKFLQEGKEAFEKKGK
jgi:thiol:disulfide interchange protein DsbD